MKLIVFTFVTFMVYTANAQSPVAYKMYDKTGKEVKFKKMIKKMSKSDVILFGELHNNAICHWMQLQVTKNLYEKAGRLMLGAEMFESDNQLIMDEYFSGLIKQNKFEDEMRMWKNYKTDYKPLVEFAKEHGQKFIATNVPRRYASLVVKKSLEGLMELSPEAKRYLPPLPIPFDTLNPAYKEMLHMDMGHGGMGGTMQLNIVKAQAIKDATMAYFILKNRKKKIPFIHFEGDFHSKNYGGIYWYLKKSQPKLKVVTVSTVEADDLTFKESYKELGDYILVIPEDMTKTY